MHRETEAPPSWADEAKEILPIGMSGFGEERSRLPQGGFVGAHGSRRPARCRARHFRPDGRRAGR
jgi:hypothetical protein